MANFSKVKTSASAVAKTEAVKAEKSVIENILIEDLVYDENNNEDISITEDLELSITKHGFLDPIIVTEFGMKKGKYRIVSGHRRTEAMKKLKKIAIPALVQKFNSEEEVSEARQRFNLASRDSAKDPLLYIRRWMMWEATHSGLSEAEKENSFMESSKLSVRQIRRYKALARMIPEVHELLSEEFGIAPSCLEPLSPLSEEEQKDFCAILKEACADEEVVLNRENINRMVKAFRNGYKDWESVKENVFAVAQKTETEIFHGGKSEVSESDTGNDTETISDEGNSELQSSDEDDNAYTEPEEVDETDAEIENEVSEFESDDSADEPKSKKSSDTEIKKNSEKLSEMLSDSNSISNSSDVKGTVKSLMNLAKIIISNCMPSIEESDEEFSALKDFLKEMIDKM